MILNNRKSSVSAQASGLRGHLRQNLSACTRYACMSRSILIMAGGTGGHIFAFGITKRTFGLSENVPGKDGFHV